MFLGFFSRRTFKGFYHSYFRYCVRSYVRNILIRDEKVEKEGKRLARGGAPRDLVTGRIIKHRENETPRQVVRRVSNEVMRSVQRNGGSMDEARGRAYDAVDEALRALAQVRGLPRNTYILGFSNPQICGDDGSWAAQVRDGRVVLKFGGGDKGWGRETPASPAVKSNGGLRGGATRIGRGVG